MSNYQPAPEGKDNALWEIAQKRASFKRHATSYVIINLFLWALWFFTGNHNNEGMWNDYPWPIWTTLGWGIGLAFSFAGAYLYPQINSTEREYQKLKNEATARSFTRN